MQLLNMAIILRAPRMLKCINDSCPFLTIECSLCWELCFGICFQLCTLIHTSSVRGPLHLPPRGWLGLSWSGPIVPAGSVQGDVFLGLTRSSAWVVGLGADQKQNRKTTNKIQLEQIASVYFGKIMLCHHDTYLNLVCSIGQSRSASCNSSCGHGSSARRWMNLAL